MKLHPCLCEHFFLFLLSFVVVVAYFRFVLWLTICLNTLILFIGEDSSSSEPVLLLPKRTYQPSHIKRKRTHGFFARYSLPFTRTYTHNYMLIHEWKTIVTIYCFLYLLHPEKPPREDEESLLGGWPRAVLESQCNNCLRGSEYF